MNDLNNEIRRYYGRKALSEKQIDAILIRSKVVRGRFVLWFIAGIAAAAVLIIEPLVYPTPDFRPKSVQIAPSDTTRSTQKEAPVQVAADPVDKSHKTVTDQKSDSLQANTSSGNPAKKDAPKKKNERRTPPPEPSSTGVNRPTQPYGITPQNY